LILLLATEGQSFLGQSLVATDASGNASFGPLSFSLPAGQSAITATATDPDGNTSEFSECLVAAEAPTPTPTPSPTESAPTPTSTPTPRQVPVGFPRSLGFLALLGSALALASILRSRS
jgi:hypothetical protein